MDKEKSQIDNIWKRILLFYKNSKDTVLHHLWLELLAMIVVGFIASGVVFFLVSYVINQTDMGTNSYISYKQNTSIIQNQLLDIVQEINNFKIKEDIVDVNFIKSQIDKWDSDRLEEYLKLDIDIDEDIVSVESSQLSIDKLIVKLKTLQQKDSWNDDIVVRYIIEYYNSIGISREMIIKDKVKLILNEAVFSNMVTSHSITYIVDSKGKLMYQDDVIVDSINLINVIKKIDDNHMIGEESEFIAIYPVIIDDEVYYLYNESDIEPFYYTEHTELGNILGGILATIAFIIIVFSSTRGKIKYIEYLSKCLDEISKGDLSYRINIIGEDELAVVAESIMNMEEALKYHIDAQLQSEKSKNELVTNMAHDLRTPLTSIIGYIGLVKDRKYSKKGDEIKYLDIAYSKAEKLKILIEDLFELTKLNHGVSSLRKEKVSLINLMQQLIEELLPLADNKQIKINTYINTGNTIHNVDIGKITRAFENILGNAIKYSPRGENIDVTFRSSNNELLIIVKNKSINISQEEVEYFFERFYRSDKSRNSDEGGSGLGLAIAKNIVELHDGKIIATLENDEITFEIVLPIYTLKLGDE